MAAKNDIRTGLSQVIVPGEQNETVSGYYFGRTEVMVHSDVPYRKTMFIILLENGKSRYYAPEVVEFVW